MVAGATDWPSVPFITVMTRSARSGCFSLKKRAEDAVLATINAEASRADLSYRLLKVRQTLPSVLGGRTSLLVHGSRKSVISWRDVASAIRRAASCAMWGGPELITVLNDW